MAQPQSVELQDLYLISSIPFCIVAETGSELSAFPKEFAELYRTNFCRKLIQRLRESAQADGVFEYSADGYRFIAVTQVAARRYLITAPVCSAASEFVPGVWRSCIRTGAIDRFSEIVRNIFPRPRILLSRLSMMGKKLYSDCVPSEREKPEQLRDLSGVLPSAPYCSAADIEAIKESIRNSDFAAFSETYRRAFFGGFSLPSGFSHRHAKRACTILLHIIAFSAIDGGMPYEYALDLFSFYIDKMDKLTELSEIEQLKLDAAKDFCLRLRTFQDTKPYRKTTVEAIRYIHRHIYQKITVKDLAAHVHLNRGTLSACFKQDTGMTITAYINAAKLKEARYLLADTEVDCSYIVDQLGFCNQSYFIKRFREYYGITPQRYRDSLV